jgi:molecular chaperone GrpE
MTKKKKDRKEKLEAEASATIEEQEVQSDAQAASEQPPPVAEKTEEEEALELRFLRLQADFDNYRKRALRERAEWQTQANENLLNDLLPVLDHYELGLSTANKHETDASVVDGFKMVYDQFVAALRKHQVEPIDSEGQSFDHNLHEAITYIPSADHPADTIIAQTRRGYRLGGKLLRPAQVVVSSGPAQEQAE